MSIWQMPHDATCLHRGRFGLCTPPLSTKPKLFLKKALVASYNGDTYACLSQSTVNM
ncbi:hypothetical protein MIDIC_110070 [Alphaproteobacteria bacterium]